MTTNAGTIDLNAALDALDGNVQLLRELAVIYIEDTPQVIEELDTAIQEGDDQVARRAVHSLKGLSSTFFSEDTTNLAGRLEERIANHGVTAIKEAEIDELKSNIRRLSETLKTFREN